MPIIQARINPAEEEYLWHVLDLWDLCAHDSVIHGYHGSTYSCVALYGLEDVNECARDFVLPHYFTAEPRDKKIGVRLWGEHYESARLEYPRPSDLLRACLAASAEQVVRWPQRRTPDPEQAFWWSYFNRKALREIRPPAITYEREAFAKLYPRRKHDNV